MPISFGAIRATPDTTGSFTAGAVSGSNTLGLVMCIGDLNNTPPTGVTWDGVAMTMIDWSRPGTDRNFSVWYVVNPASGGTIVIASGAYRQGRDYYFTGVDQTAPIDSQNKGTTGVQASITVATTVVASNCWTVMNSKDDGVGTTTYTVDVGVVREGPDGGGECLSDSNATVGTGSQSTTQTLSSGSARHGGIAFSIAPAAAATPSPVFVPHVIIFS